MRTVMIMLLALLSFPGLARQPHFDETLLEIEQASPEGISVVVFNRSKQLKTVVLKPGSNGNVQFEQRKFRLEPGARRLVELEIEAQERRRALVHLTTEVTGEEEDEAWPGYVKPF